MSETDDDGAKIWAQGEPGEIVWSNVSYTVKGRTVLTNSSGYVCGQLTVMLGASGAGKTVLLNVLAARIKTGKVEGAAYVNGEKVNKQLMKQTAGYVMQEDLHFSHLTVRETLEFAANCRLPATWSHTRKVERVNEVILQLGLKRCADVIVGGFGKQGISGGQRKRLSIGVELLGRPPVLFLDEPTSGLDSATAFSIMSLLKSLTTTSTVICTLHQPSARIFELFDQLIVLSHGLTTYYGPASEALSFYSSQGFPCPELYNPASHFLDVICADPVKLDDVREAKENEGKLAEGFKEYDSKQRVNLYNDYKPAYAPPKHHKGYHKRLNPFLQLFHLLQRSATNTYRDYRAIGTAVFQNCISAVMIGLVFLQLPDDQTGISRRFSSLFFIAVNQGFYATYGVLASFPLERNIVLRERQSGTYQVLPYILGKSIAELPLQILYPLMFCNIVYWMVGYEITFYKYAHFVILCQLGSLTAISLGLFLSSASPTLTLAMVVAPLVLEGCRLFGAFFSTPVELPGWLIWIQALSFITYVYTGMARNELRGLKFICKPDQLVGGVCPITTGEQALLKSNLWEIDPYQCELVLLAMILIYRVMTYVAVRKNKLTT